MNHEGFTLMELIAVIAILSILAIITTPAVINVRKEIIESTFDSKVSMIESAAIDYGNDHIRNIPSPITGDDSNDCLNVLVKTLIFDGYLSGDDEEKTSIMNPIRGESFNFETVCIKFDRSDLRTRKIVAELKNKNNLRMWK